MTQKEIKSIFVFNEIFSFIKDENFKYKLTVHSKKYQEKMNLNLDSFKDAHYNYFSNSYQDIFTNLKLNNQNKDQFCKKLDYVIKNLLNPEINEDTNIKYLEIINRTLCRDVYLLKIFNNDSIINFGIAKNISLAINKLIIIFFKNKKEKQYEKKLNNQSKDQFCEKLDYIIKNLTKPEINEDTNIKYLTIINRTLCEVKYLLKIFNDDSIINFEISKNISLTINRLITIFFNNKEKKDYVIELNFILDSIKDIMKEYNKKHIKQKDKVNFSCIYDLLNNIINNKEEILNYYFENDINEFLLEQMECEENENRNMIYNLLICIFKKKNKLLLLNENQRIYKIINLNLIKILFEEKKELYIIILNIIFIDNSYMKEISIKLFRIFNDLEEEKINEDFLNFLLELITMDNKFILERFTSFLGYPSLIIKSIPNGNSKNSEINNDNIKNDKKEYHQKWPLFGEKLINGDINKHIYEYKCKNHIKKNLCILSLLFPNDYDEENNINKNLSEKFKKKLIIDILNNCLKEKNNYYLFKYIYLMPSRNLLYNNLYEEMISILKDEKIFDLEEIKIKEKYFIKRIKNEIEISIKRFKNEEQINNLSDDDFKYMDMNNFIGFKSDIIPGEIVKEEISEIATTRILL